MVGGRHCHGCAHPAGLLILNRCDARGPGCQIPGYLIKRDRRGSLSARDEVDAERSSRRHVRQHFLLSQSTLQLRVRDVGNLTDDGVRAKLESQLRAYEAVYLVESGAPHRLNRSPFHDNAVYEHVRGQLGRDRGTHVTVVFTDVTCNGMGKHMRTSSKQEEDCLASPAGRRESFQRFSARVGVLQGDLEGDYFYVDAEEGLSVTGQVTLALDASPLIASDCH